MDLASLAGLAYSASLVYLVDLAWHAKRQNLAIYFWCGGGFRGRGRWWKKGI